MDLEAEVKALETKLRGVCSPEIFLEPQRFVSGDPAVVRKLVGRILQSGPVEVQKQLVDEGTYTPLCHFVGEDWYAVFSRFLKDNQTVLAIPGLPEQDVARSDLIVLPWDQWRRRSFAAVKVRQVSMFVDILRKRVPHHRNLRQMEIERLNRIASGSVTKGRAFVTTAPTFASASSASVFGSSLRPAAGGKTEPTAETLDGSDVDGPGTREEQDAHDSRGGHESGQANAPRTPDEDIAQLARESSYQLQLKSAQASGAREKPSAYQLLVQVGHAISRLDEKLDEVLRRVAELERRVSRLE